MDLSIDYNQTRQLGNSILEKANDFSEVLNKITSENDNLKNSWKGSDAESAYQRVNETNQDGIR